ncbi:MAG: hypothetical protein IMZ58_01205 [Thermoplasmata archaeon]|nr:hypothetical protein [Thermoplasmata archaeon]
MGIFGKTEMEKAKLEIEKQQAIVDKYNAEQTAVAREKQAKKTKMEKELRQYKEDNFNYGVGQSLSWRLCLFYTRIARDQVNGLNQFWDLARKMNLESYFKSLDKTDTPVPMPTYDSEDNRTN